MDVRAVLYAPVAGVLKRVAGTPSGWESHFPTTSWCPGEQVAEMNSACGGAATCGHAIFVGERYHYSFEDDRCFLGGLHHLVRAWWGPPQWRGECPTILSLGTCEQLGLFPDLRTGMFPYWLKRLGGPIQLAVVPPRICVPSVAAIRSVLECDEAFRLRCLEDLATWFPVTLPAQSSVPGPPSDWFATAMIANWLTNSPFLHPMKVLDGDGQSTLGGRRLVVLSLGAELALHLQHTKLGYTLSIPGWWAWTMSESLRSALGNSFTSVQPSVAETIDNLRWLARHLRENHNTRVAVLNLSPMWWRTYTYQPGTEVPDVRATELNFAVRDLAETGEIALVDVEEASLRLGRSQAYLDGFHPKFALERELNDVMLRLFVRELGLTPLDCGEGESPDRRRVRKSRASCKREVEV